LAWHCEIKPVSVREALIDGGVRDEADTWFSGHYAPGSRRCGPGSGGPPERYVYSFAGIPQIGNERNEIGFA
jgi:hypothetical protein